MPTIEQFKAVDREHARIVREETHMRFLCLYYQALYNQEEN